MEARILLENNMESMVQEIRREDPGIGAYKLFLMLKDIYGKRMFGRDRFYKFLHQKHLMLPAQKRRHTTNSNHNYRKYKNQIKGCHATDLLYTHLTKKRESNGKERNQSSQIQY